MAWYHRVWNVVRPEGLSRDLDREMEFHLAERTDELIAAGLEPEAAAREARRRFGHRMRQKRSTHDVDVVVWLESLLADVRYAVRGLVRSPAFTLVAVLSLALGIGANTAIFSLANALLLRSLPVRDPGALVQIDRGSEHDDVFTNPLWEQIQDRQSVFSGVFAHGTTSFNLARSGVARRVPGAAVSGGFFSTLGVLPAAGRLLGPADDVRGCPTIAAVSDGFAQREYGSAPAAVGRTLSLDGHPFQVVGVASPGFTGIRVGSSVDVYVPICTAPVLTGEKDVLDLRSRWFLQLIGRLKKGVTAAQAGAQLAALAPAIDEATLPAKWGAESQKRYLAATLAVRPAAKGLSYLRDRYGRALESLMGIVALVLLIACANIANLLLARAASRREESSIRQALGAGRARLVRQLLTETVLLSLLGAAAGVLFARWAAGLLVGFLSSRGETVWLDLTPDLRVLGFTLAVAVATGLLFGLAPAWFAARSDPLAATRAGSRGAAGGARHSAGKALVLAQVALSLVLVVAAGLLVGSFRRLSTLDPGFDRRGVLLVDADFSGTDLEGERRAAARRDLLERLRAVPGVDSASASMITPVSGIMWNEVVTAPGFEPKERDDGLAYFNTVSGGYFTTLGTPLLAGRDLSATDGAEAPRVAVVDEVFARKVFGKANPLGKTFRTQVGDGTSDPMEVVGVVGDAKYGSLDEDPPPSVYLPFGQGDEFGTHMSFELRTGGSPGALRAAVRQAVARVSPAITFEATPLSEQLAASLTRPRLLATLSGFFGALALLLAMIGLYGTLSYAVTRRRGEIGVRMALGAAGRQVLRMVFAEAGLLVLAGLAVGTALALAATRFIASFLYGVGAADPVTLAVSAGLLAATALGAALLPAARAAAVDPNEVLRE